MDAFIFHLYTIYYICSKTFHTRLTLAKLVASPKFEHSVNQYNSKRNDNLEIMLIISQLKLSKIFLLINLFD